MELKQLMRLVAQAAADFTAAADGQGETISKRKKTKEAIEGSQTCQNRRGSEKKATHFPYFGRRKENVLITNSVRPERGIFYADAQSQAEVA